AAETGDVGPSHTTLWRQRRQERAAGAEGIREAFQPNHPLTVHWDGIKLPPLDGRPVDGKDFVERLPVIVTGNGVDQLLRGGVIESGTGFAQATEVISALDAWKCRERVTSACSDTTLSNTGCNIGAVVRMEEILGKTLIYLACRHHMLEVIPKNTYEKTVECSTSPDIGTLCKEFRKQWEHINQHNYKPATEDPRCAHILTVQTTQKILQFAKKTLERPAIRCDYKYLLELVVIFLGEVPPTQRKGVHFQPPIALSSARFMGRIIYSLTIQMFALTDEYQIPDTVLTK
ncbi:hypothetical protein FOCC_FOCC012969, partial [Frankliniella occidentalis]